MTGQARLRRCPKCGGRWPDDDSHSLRALRFMDNLPRGITPMNLDAIAIHNGADGDEFYIFEVKLPHEQWPMQMGQRRAYEAMAKLPRFRVFVLRGTEREFDVYQILPPPHPMSAPYRVSGSTFHDWLDRWLDERHAA